jgi:hypothetical protein
LPPSLRLLTSHVVNNWPGSMIFSGASLGGNITSGSRLSDSPDTSPIRAAYRWSIGCYTGSGSWDQVTMLYAVTGLGDTFRFGNRYGYNRVHRDGSNSWVFDPGLQTRKWIELADGVSNTTVAVILDDLYSALPTPVRCQSLRNKPGRFDELSDTNFHTATCDNISAHHYDQILGFRARE